MTVTDITITCAVLIFRGNNCPKAVASRGGQGEQLPPPGHIEPDKSSLWMDSVVLIVLSCNRLPFSWPSNYLVHSV